MNNPRESASSAVDLGIGRPHSARIWNYWLGGKDNFPADREAGDMVEQLIPGIKDSARADRAFLGRAVQHFVADEGIRQFLDIGTGLPTADNTHEVAQRIAPECKIVYVDNDPLVLAHARALLVGAPEGVTTYIDADLRDPRHILDTVAETLDFDKPVAVMLLGIMHHIIDDDEARQIVRALVDAIPSGSYLALAHATAEVHGDAMHESMRKFMERGGTPIVARDRVTLANFFDGLELLEPGVVSCSRWRSEETPWGEPAEVSQFCGVGRKP
ncbi:O-Methyltransferase involved in polyketide biosynthesis [Sinosporangium album]|uniref:O-Methyltransferase involved in polyketide biosynthesis n=1 Tax=Sinosporangium album TaxID=504805 RepID=A0A1G7Z1T1_9ACTN|nr:SAM-dependent methyltransferase [Sinosporangium album]SDH02604.1 O-Methyltransferase involved in polyketide biosynthesis [Sinosporangium album]